MTETFTQCPYCQTSFLVSDLGSDDSSDLSNDADLSVEDDMVRCDACHEIFQIHSIDEKAELQQNLLDLENEESLEILQAESIAGIHEEPINVSPTDHSPASSPGRFLLICLLLIILTGQILWVNLEKAVQSPRLDPVTNILCKVITCPDKNTNDIANFVTEEIIVRSHPLYADALQVDFIFNNSSSSEKDFPLAQLSFTDTRGQLLANRFFSSREYLPENLQYLDKMPAGARIQTSLEIVDPGQGATNYSLEFKK